MSHQAPKQFQTPAAPKQLKERDLLKTNPNKEQFEPTPVMPMPQRQRMGGAG